MPVILEGGCRVSGLREGQPRRDGSLRIWHHAGREAGAQAISLRVLELDAGGGASLGNDDADEALYVLEGQAGIEIDGQSYDAGPDTAIYLRRGTLLELSASGGGAVTLVSSRCPEPEGQAARATSGSLRQPDQLGKIAPVIRLDDRPVQVTGDRWYRETINGDVGSDQMTQFVGSIPPGRAPDHFHLYEEVICILSGYGVMWAGSTSTGIEAGACIFLPRQQAHCLENTSTGELSLLGVFYPAGSPAVRYPAPAR